MAEFDPTRMGRPDSHICGDNVLGNPLGCSEEIRDPDGHGFRCTDCGVLFHRHCARKHFDESQSNEGRLDWSNRAADWIKGCVDGGLPLDEVLAEFRHGTWWRGTK